MVGRLKDLTFSRDGGQTVTVCVKADFREAFDELKDCEVDVEIKRHREKRSRDANAYCWTLCGKIAEVLSADDPAQTKDSVYRSAVREVGVYRDFHDLRTEEAESLRTAWSLLGTGWMSEQVDFSQDGDRVTIRCYYGSSRYNTKQMSRLIDSLVQDAKALGIPTETPEEIEKIKSLWATEPPARKGENK